MRVKPKSNLPIFIRLKLYNKYAHFWECIRYLKHTLIQMIWSIWNNKFILKSGAKYVHLKHNFNIPFYQFVVETCWSKVKIANFTMTLWKGGKTLIVNNVVEIIWSNPKKHSSQWFLQNVDAVKREWSIRKANFKLKKSLISFESNPIFLNRVGKRRILYWGFTI